MPCPRFAPFRPTSEIRGNARCRTRRSCRERFRRSLLGREFAQEANDRRAYAVRLVVTEPEMAEAHRARGVREAYLSASMGHFKAFGLIGEPSWRLRVPTRWALRGASKPSQSPPSRDVGWGDPSHGLVASRRGSGNLCRSER